MTGFRPGPPFLVIPKAATGQNFDPGMKICCAVAWRISRALGVVGRVVLVPGGFEAGAGGASGQDSAGADLLIVTNECFGAVVTINALAFRYRAGWESFSRGLGTWESVPANQTPAWRQNFAAKGAAKRIADSLGGSARFYRKALMRISTFPLVDSLSISGTWSASSGPLSGHILSGEDIVSDLTLRERLGAIFEPALARRAGALVLPRYDYAALAGVLDKVDMLDSASCASIHDLARLDECREVMMQSSLNSQDEKKAMAEQLKLLPASNSAGGAGPEETLETMLDRYPVEKGAALKAPDRKLTGGALSETVWSELVEELRGFEDGDLTSMMMSTSAALRGAARGSAAWLELAQGKALLHRLGRERGIALLRRQGKQPSDRITADQALIEIFRPYFRDHISAAAYFRAAYNGRNEPELVARIRDRPSDFGQARLIAGVRPLADSVEEWFRIWKAVLTGPASPQEGARQPIGNHLAREQEGRKSLLGSGPTQARG